MTVGSFVYLSRPQVTPNLVLGTPVVLSVYEFRIYLPYHKRTIDTLGGRTTFGRDITNIMDTFTFIIHLSM